MLFYLTHSYSPIRCYHSRPEWTWERWQWRSTPHSPKLQHSCNLTSRLFNVINRTLVRGGLFPSAEVQSVYSTAQADWASGLSIYIYIYIYIYIIVYMYRMDLALYNLQWLLCYKTQPNLTVYIYIYTHGIKT